MPDTTTQQILVLAHSRVRSEGHPEHIPGQARLIEPPGIFAHYETDAHVAQYVAPERLTKRYSFGGDESLMDEMRFESLFLDYDHPGHRSLDLTELEPEWERLMEALGRLDHPPTLVYSTAGGYRFGWLLDQSAKTHHAMGVQRTLARQVAAVGFVPDAACIGQPTRLFRLPFVMRSSERTWVEPYSQYCYDDGPTLDLRSIQTSAWVQRPLPRPASRRVTELGAPPDAIEARASVFKDGDPQQGHTRIGAKLHKAVETAMTRSGDWIDDGQASQAWRALQSSQSALPTMRNEALTRLVGTFSRCGVMIPGVTPMHAFGLMEPLLYRLDQQSAAPEDSDRGASDWSEFAWLLLREFWPEDEERHRAEITQRQARQELEAVSREAHYAGLVATIERDWPILPLDLDAEWVRSHLVLKHGTSLYVMDPSSAMYHGPFRSVASDVFPALLRSRKLVPALLDVADTDDEGRDRRVPSVELYARHCQVIMDVRSQFTAHPGGYLDGDTLVYSSCSPRPGLTPAYSQEIDDFLRGLVGEEDFEAFCYVLAYLPETKVPLGAIVLKGESQAGKSLLIAGAERLWDKPASKFSAISTRFNSSLARSPLVVDEEMVADRLSRAKAAAVYANLKQMISGSTVELEQKGVDSQPYTAMFRVIACTNEDNVVERLLLGGDEYPTADTINSMVRRLNVFRAQRSKHVPGRKVGTRWIQQNVIAEHILWLNERLKSGRWLDMAGPSDDIVAVRTAAVEDFITKTFAIASNYESGSTILRCDHGANPVMYEILDSQCRAGTPNAPNQLDIDGFAPKDAAAFIDERGDLVFPPSYFNKTCRKQLKREGYKVTMKNVRENLLTYTGQRHGRPVEAVREFLNYQGGPSWNQNFLVLRHPDAVLSEIEGYGYAYLEAMLRQCLKRSE